MNTYFQTDELQKLINWGAIMPMSRYAGGHDDQMKSLFKNVTVIAHWNEDDYQGQVATCVKFNDGKFKNHYGIYNDYYGSCSGCDSWGGASDDDVRKMCIDLSNGTYIFKNIEDVKAFLQTPNDEDEEWSSWTGVAPNLLLHINSGKVD